MHRDGTLRRWDTLVERSCDERTGVIAEIQRVKDEWIWSVPGQAIGNSSSQKRARAAARSYVRGLKTSASTRQLTLF